MIPFRFAYEAPQTVAEAVELLAGDSGAARVLGGGTWLVPEMTRGDSTPRLVVGLKRAGLAEIRANDTHVYVGAMCTYSDLLGSDLVAARLPLLSRMAEGVTGGRQIANQGTLGGSVAAARPSSDAPATVVALGGEARIAGTAGERRCAAADLFAGPMRTTLGRDEILLGFDFPAAASVGAGYVKLKRGESSWPIATAACLVELDRAGRCSRASLALGGVGETPIGVEVELLLGRTPDEEAIVEAARLARDAVRAPWADELAPAAYRAAVAGPVARRALAAACADAIAKGAEHEC
jgi:aerobic carbon-monoxide dehydrogenase medium subunit